MHTHTRSTADQPAGRPTDDGFICAARDPNSTLHVQDNTRFGRHDLWGKVLPERGS
jgi:hypothetical protein